MQLASFQDGESFQLLHESAKSVLISLNSCHLHTTFMLLSVAVCFVHVVHVFNLITLVN